MKKYGRALALVIVPLALAPIAPAILGDPTATPQDEKQEFRNNFQQAMTINSRDEMSRLVKKHQDQAVIWIIETAELIALTPSETVFDRMAALKEAWTTSIKTEFCSHMEKYFSLMDPGTKRARKDLRKKYTDASKEYFDNREKKDKPTFTILGNTFEGLASSFEQIGDYYYASQCWSFTGHCFDEENQGNKADLKLVCKAFGKVISTREKIGLEDRLFRDTQPRYKQLVALGFAGDAGPEGEGNPVAPKAAGNAITAAMTFELIDDIEKPERPNYFLDAHYQMWNSLYIEAKGSRIDVPRFEDGPRILRVGSADIQVDVDRDGEGDVKIPMTGKLSPVEFEIGDGAAKRKWAFLVVPGLEKDTYQGFEVNLSPQENQISLYMAPAGSMTGEIGGVTVSIIDESLDGLYGNLPQSWAHIGMTPDHFQPEIDSFLVAGEKRARPWSQYQKIGDQWYDLEVQDGGTSIIATPTELVTGSLKLKYKGPKPTYVVVKGSNDFENSYFDISGGKSVEVPIGRYELYYGFLSKGKKLQSVKALILPSDRTPTWSVTEGEEAVVELGAPYGFDFQYEVDEDTIIIDGETVVVTGSANERYERPWGCVPRPEASYRKAGSKRGGKPERMGALMGTDEIYDLGWKAAWSPKNLTLSKKKSETDVEVQLTEKKNKLFGKIESAWQ